MSQRKDISGLKNAQFLRLHHKAGGLSMKEVCYDELRDIASHRMESIIRNASYHAQSRKAKTINEADMRYAIKLSGHSANMVL